MLKVLSIATLFNLICNVTLYLEINSKCISVRRSINLSVNLPVNLSIKLSVILSGNGDHMSEDTMQRIAVRALSRETAAGVDVSVNLTKTLRPDWGCPLSCFGTSGYPGGGKANRELKPYKIEFDHHQDHDAMRILLGSQNIQTGITNPNKRVSSKHVHHPTNSRSNFICSNTCVSAGIHAPWVAR